MNNSNPPADEVFVEETGKERPIEENLKSRGTWTRLLFMVICGILISIASFVGGFVVVLGFLWVLVTGEVNRQLREVLRPRHERLGRRVLVAGCDRDRR